MGGYYFAVMDIAPAFVGIIQGINKTVSFYLFFFFILMKNLNLFYLLFISPR